MELFNKLCLETEIAHKNFGSGILTIGMKINQCHFSYTCFFNTLYKPHLVNSPILPLSQNWKKNGQYQSPNMHEGK